MTHETSTSGAPRSPIWSLTILQVVQQLHLAHTPGLQRRVGHRLAEEAKVAQHLRSTRDVHVQF